MLRVVKLSIRFVLYRSADDDDDALKLSFSRCFAPTFPTVSRATWEKLSNSRERTNVWQCHKWGRQWAMHSGARALKLEQCAPSFSLRDRFDAVLPSLSVCLSLSRKSCAGICVSQARFEFCMNCISSLKNENKASNYLKFDNLLALRICALIVYRASQKWRHFCQSDVNYSYMSRSYPPPPSPPLPKAKGQMHIMRALYDLGDFYINTDTDTHTYGYSYSYRGLAAILF